jgi:hypothetical protein
MENAKSTKFKLAESLIAWLVSTLHGSSRHRWSAHGNSWHIKNTLALVPSILQMVTRDIR